jgi:hypothetical protein
MNYLAELPEELKGTLYTYLDPTKIFNLSKILRLHVDYSKQILFEYPNNFKYLKEYFNDEDEYKLFKELRGIQFNDDLLNVITYIGNINFNEIDIYFKFSYIYNILSNIILKLNYTKYNPILIKLPNHRYKYLCTGTDPHADPLGSGGLSPSIN